MNRTTITLILALVVVAMVLLGCLDPPTPIVEQTEPADSIHLDPQDAWAAKRARATEEAK